MDEQKFMESRCLCWKSKLALVHTGGVGRARWLLGWSAAALRVSTQAALLLQCCNAQLYLSARTLLLITINNDESMVLLCPRSERVERWGGGRVAERRVIPPSAWWFFHVCAIFCRHWKCYAGVMSIWASTDHFQVYFLPGIARVTWKKQARLQNLWMRRRWRAALSRRAMRLLWLLNMGAEMKSKVFPTNTRELRMPPMLYKDLNIMLIFPMKLC